jgi:uncharacterized protein
MGAPERATRDRGLSDPSIVRVRAVIEAGLAALEERREEVNRLNRASAVGGPDGDTGDNMVLTLRAVLEELDRLAGSSEGRADDPGGDRAPQASLRDLEIGRGEIVASVARAALLGARGSSGVILSQLIRGAAEELASRPGELIDPVLIGAALARAADQAYGSVRDPAEGTMLTVVREMAHRVASALAHRPEARLGPRTTALEQDLAIAEVIASALHPVPGGDDGGPEGLRALHDAALVDAGGYGLLVFTAGIVSALRGSGATVPRPAPELPVRDTPPHTSITYRWCTNFAVIGEGLSPRALRPALEAIGDSVLVVGDAMTLKVHVHTDDPDAATAVFAGGRVTRLEVLDMRPGAADGPPAPTPASGLVALVDEPGLRELFAGIGAQVIGPEAAADGGLARAIGALTAPEAVVVTAPVDGRRAIAERVAGVERPVELIEAGSVPAALAAAAAHVAAHAAAENAAAMRAAAARVRVATVAPAAVPDAQGRFAAGDALGEVDGELVAWGTPAEALRGVVARLATDAEIISCLVGADPPLAPDAVRELAGAVAREVGEAGVTVSAGGQTSSWWLLSAQ